MRLVIPTGLRVCPRDLLGRRLCSDELRSFVMQPFQRFGPASLKRRAEVSRNLQHRISLEM